MSKDLVMINAEIERSAREKFHHFCKSSGTTMSRVMRSFIDGLIADVDVPQDLDGARDPMLMSIKDLGKEINRLMLSKDPVAIERAAFLKGVEYARVSAKAAGITI